MHLRHLQYFVALARERHFGRAAAAVNITQSTLSAAIRQLEAEIGAPLIERDRRFREFTAEGQTLLNWARRILFEREALDQEIALLSDRLRGALSLGVIPTALPTIALLTTPFYRSHPDVTLKVFTQTSNEIQQGLDDFRIDAGITYLDNEPLHGVRAIPLYDERYILLTFAKGPFAGRDKVTWHEAAEMPLSLLTADMQNRRIVDGIFREVGRAPKVQAETNSVMSLCSHIRTGEWSSVLPHNFLWVFGTPPGMLALPLVEPIRTHTVGLVVRDQEPLPPLVRAIEAVAREADMGRDLAALAI